MQPGKSQIYGLSPVWMRSCAFRDLSRGNTRPQNLHLIVEGDTLPSQMRFVRFSDLGRPRLEADVDEQVVEALDGEGDEYDQLTRSAGGGDEMSLLLLLRLYCSSIDRVGVCSTSL